MSHTLYVATKALNIRTVSVLGKCEDGEFPPVDYIHAPEPLPEYVQEHWAVFGVPLTVVPVDFKAVLLRGRGRGKGRRMCEVERKTVLPSRVAKGIAKDANDAARLEPAGPRGISVRDYEPGLEHIDAGKPVTGQETSWEDLV